MQIGKFRPCHRDHLNGRIELHGARAKRNHRTIQCQITISKAAHIAGDLGFCAVQVEDRMRQIICTAQIGGWQTIFDIFITLMLNNAVGQVTTKTLPDRFDGFRAGLLVKADAYLGFANFTQVDAV